MGKLSLVLADGDTEYLSKLERYLIVNYPQRFDIISFASREKLDIFLNGTNEPDILLVNGGMLTDGPITADTGKTVILDDGCTTPLPAGYDTTEKYQHMDRLVADLLRLYASREMKDRTAPGKCRTRLICVCSPGGGTGKSSIAAGCSILYESRGSRAFYLNLEAVPSTEVFFHSDAGSGQSFSNAIYHLKGKNNNLGLKLEGASSMDRRTGVHYFRPPEKLSELNELSEQDIVLLLDTFRKSSVYDIVFIDIDSGFSPLNTEVIKRSDVILLVLAPRRGMPVKCREFADSMEYIRGRHGAGHAGRVVPVLNRLGGTRQEGKMQEAAGPYAVMPEIAAGLFAEYSPAAVINECAITSAGDFNSALTENLTFLSGIGNLCYCITPVTESARSSDGGESIAS